MTDVCDLSKMTGIMTLGVMSVATECQEELPPSQVSQLAPCCHCRPDDVCLAENRQNGALHDGP